MQLIQRPVTQLQVLLALAVMLGGGGVVYGFRHMAIQLFAIALLAINARLVKDFVCHAPRGLVILLCLTLVFPLLQAVPLPPAVWQALPGRELVAEAYLAVGIPTDSWFTFSVDPLRTIVAFCAMLAPATFIVLGWSLPAGERALLGKTLIVLAACVMLLGVVQLSSANTVGLFQRIEPDPDVLYGTFSNRNSTGIFFVIATLVVAAVPWVRTRIWSFAPAVIGGLFVVTVILTQSRSSMVLLAVLLAFVAARVAATYLQGRKAGVVRGQGRMLAGSAVVLLVVFVAVITSAVAGGRAGQSLERFSQLDDDRLEMWDDGAFVAGRYWPLGAGTGTFDEVFQVDESLEYVSPARAGRAHNDYIELVIETGAIGLVLLLAWFAWLASATWRRRGDADRWLAFAAHAGLVCVALQSVLDYPLRNQAMLCTAALLVVFLLPARKEQA